MKSRKVLRGLRLDSLARTANNAAMNRTHGARTLCAAILVAVAVFIGALAVERAIAEKAPAGNKNPNAAEVKRGRHVYSRYCIGCHGREGEGDGAAAKMLYPPPRNLVEADFKFSSRSTPGLPTDEDLTQLLQRGLKGTAMPSFHEVPSEDLRAVIAYIKTLSEKWKEDQSEPIEIPADPWADKEAEGVAEGDRVYHAVAMCMSCHPSYHDANDFEAMYRKLGYETVLLRPNAQLAVPQKNPDGTLTVPPDFKRDWVKTGADARNLYRVISAGITTTAMPTWVETLQPDQIWGLAHYISSLAAQRPYRLDPATYQARPALDLLVSEPKQDAGEEFKSEK